MSNADLLPWLGARGHGVFAPAIVRAGVDLATLRTMNGWDLEKIGIPESTHRAHLVADLKVAPVSVSRCDHLTLLCLSLSLLSGSVSLNRFVSLK